MMNPSRPKLWQLASAWLLVATSQAQAADYVPVGLSVSGFHSVVNIDNAGRIVGSWKSPYDATVHASMMTGNSDTSAVYYGGSTYQPSYAIAANAAGQVLVNSTDSSRPEIWTGSTFTALNGLASYGASARDINASGQAVGSSFLDTATNGLASHAVSWLNGPTATDLGTLGGNQSLATSLNDSGQIAGYSSITGNPNVFHATLWNGTSITDLGTLGQESSFAYDINNLGLVVGAAGISGGHEQAATWLNGVGTFLATPDGFSSRATQVNNAGQIIGWISNGTEQRATLWDSGQAIDLTAYLEPYRVDAGYYFSSALAINDQGELVVAMTSRATPWVVNPVRLAVAGTVPGIPEAGTQAMMLLGFAALAFAARQRRGAPR